MKLYRCPLKFFFKFWSLIIISAKRLPQLDPKSLHNNKSCGIHIQRVPETTTVGPPCGEPTNITTCVFRYAVTIQKLYGPGYRSYFLRAIYHDHLSLEILRQYWRPWFFCRSHNSWFDHAEELRVLTHEPCDDTYSEWRLCAVNHHRQ